MSIRSQDIDRAWAKLGMKIKDGKHKRALLYHNGILVIKTLRSHGSAKLDGHIPEKIRNQMRLSREEFQELLACPLGLPEYLEILDSQGNLSK